MGAKDIIKRAKVFPHLEQSLNKILSLGYRVFALIGEILTPLKFFDGDKNHRIDYGPEFHANAFIFIAK